MSIRVKSYPVAARRCRAMAALLLVVSIFGCASTSVSTKIQAPFMLTEDNPIERRNHAVEVISDIEKRNAQVEASPEWIKNAYKKPLFRNLSEIGDGDYAAFSRFLDNGSLYVIVHPAYYTFFHDADLFPDNGSGIVGRNAMDRFLDEASFSTKSMLIKAQEKMLRDFLEYASTEKKLVLLVLPRGYREFQAYKFRRAQDEYIRYLNEVTNESESVIYMYSKKPNRGTLTDKDRKTLLKFLYAVKPKEILIGGGYVGRCLEDFHRDLEQYYGEDKLYLVPELAAISPSDLTASAVMDVVNADGTVNIARLSANIKTNVFSNQDVSPKLKSLSRPDVLK